MHPSPKPKQRKRSSMSSKETEDSSVQIYWQAQAHRALHRDSLAEWDQQRRSFMSTATPTGVRTVVMRGGRSGSWMEISAAGGQTKRSLYIWLWHKWQTYRHTDRQKDRRSSSRFSAYLFFQRACQTVEKHLMQTEKVSECYFLTSSALGLFSFCLRGKSKLSSIWRPKVWPERPWGQGTAVLLIPLTHFLSLSLSLCWLSQQCLMEKRW